MGGASPPPSGCILTWAVGGRARGAGTGRPTCRRGWRRSERGRRGAASGQRPSPETHPAPGPAPPRQALPLARGQVKGGLAGPGQGVLHLRLVTPELPFQPTGVGWAGAARLGSRWARPLRARVCCGGLCPWVEERPARL